MSIEDNINSIESIFSGLWSDISTKVIQPVTVAVQSGGKNISADVDAVGSAALVIANAVSKIPGNVGAEVGMFTPLATELINFAESIANQWGGAPAPAATPPAPATTAATVSTPAVSS